MFKWFYRSNNKHRNDSIEKEDIALTSYTERVTPEWIKTLSDSEVFVFGSNLAGHHDGGAANKAPNRFSVGGLFEAFLEK